MKPLQKFRSPEDEENANLFRKDSLPVKSSQKITTYIKFLSLMAMIVYGYLLIESFQGRWFDPRWATDDSLQQSFVFHEIAYPGLFSNDIIAEMMRYYVSPIHYYLGMAITYFTRDPIMTGHWIMLVQLLLAVGFLFAAVKNGAGIIPAAASVIWFLHTRNIIQRVTAGLQRGWAPALLFGYIYFLIKQNHRAINILIIVAWLLHAPSALLISASYGLYLVWRVLQLESRNHFKKPLLHFLLLCPLFAVVAFVGVRKPEHLGEMVSYKIAQEMPEFSSVNGRFKMVPLWSRWDEIKEFGFQAFNSSLVNSGSVVEKYCVPVVILLSLILLLVARVRREKISISEAVTLLLGIFFTYELSRLMAFKLFVPQRYLQIPMTVLFCAFVPILIWKIFAPKKRSSDRSTLHALGVLSIFGIVIATGSGSGLQGDANFNMPSYVRGDLWSWVDKTLPRDAVIAGYPSHIDGAQLFGKRRAFVTNETSHPFYDKYYKEMARRIEISLKAHFSRDLAEIVSLMEPEGVTHFVFKRKSFYPDALKNANYFSPFDKLVKQLTSYAPEEYAYKKLPKEVETDRFPFLIYRDDQSAVIDIKALKAFLSK